MGESVHLLEQNGDWYFGCSNKNREIRGIFPKAYIHVADSITDKSGYVIHMLYAISLLPLLFPDWIALFMSKDVRVSYS